MEKRIILHVDMDAFFASIEVLRHPELKGKPVVIGGDPDKRGVVSTCTYEARKYGIRSAMPLFEAKQKCPHAIFLDVNFSLYRQISQRIMELLQQFTEQIEVVSIDEAYLDITQTAEKHGGAFKLGQALRRLILAETQLTCSVGIGSNKLIAKICSSLAKPNGLYEVTEGQEAAFLAPLPIQSIPGIGTKTQMQLNRDGFQHVSDLQQKGLDALINLYGTHGYSFHRASFGLDNRQVIAEDLPPKSIGAEITFEIDQNDPNILQEALKERFEKAYRRLRQHSMRSKGINLKLRFSNFKTITRSMTFCTHLNDHELLLKETLALFKRSYESEVPLRLIGISFEKLTDGYWQPLLW